MEIYKSTSSWKSLPKLIIILKILPKCLHFLKTLDEFLLLLQIFCDVFRTYTLVLIQQIINLQTQILDLPDNRSTFTHIVYNLHTSQVKLIASTAYYFLVAWFLKSVLMPASPQFFKILNQLFLVDFSKRQILYSYCIVWSAVKKIIDFFIFFCAQILNNFGPYKPKKGSKKANPQLHVSEETRTFQVKLWN